MIADRVTIVRRVVAGLAVAAPYALVSAIVLSFVESDFVTGSTAPASIYRPDIGRNTAWSVVALSVIAVGVVPRRWRLVALLAWSIALGLLGHRVTNGLDDLRDIWFAIEITEDRRYAETDPEPRRCNVGPLPALCVVRGGVERRIVTVLPFVRLDRGD